MARQGGIHVSYLIVAIVICLGLVGFIVVVNNAREEIRGDLAEAQQAATVAEERLRKANEELYQAREVLSGSEESADYEYFNTFLDDARGEWAKVSGLGGTDFRSLEEFTRVAYDTTKHWRQEFQSQLAAAQAKDAEYVQEVASNRTIVEAKLDEINELKRRIEDLQTQLESTEADARETASRLREELEEQSDVSNTEIANKDREIWVLRNQLGQARRRIEHLESEIVIAPDFDDVDPDGSVIQVDNELGYVWIDLGRQDRLRAGLRFDVFSYVKGGKKLRKGQIEIMNVEEEIAKARVLNTIDRFNPLSEGDSITSPFYSKSDVPTFVFAGEKLSSNEYSLEEVERRVENYGGKVEDEVEIETTFVVAIDGYEASPQYATARRLGITILSERDLLNFVGY